MKVERSWARIRTWYDKNAPAGTLRLADAASDTALLKLEETIGVELPIEFKESYRIHNGTCDSWLVHFGVLLSTEGITKEWNRLIHLQEETGFGAGPNWVPTQLKSDAIKKSWWNRLRIPLTENGGGSPVTLDLDPTNAGSVGQIIDFLCDSGPTELLTSNFEIFLEKIAGDLESNYYIYDDEEGMVRPTEWDA